MKHFFQFVIYWVLTLQCYGQVDQLNCSEVKMESGLPTLFVNGEARPAFAYMSYLGKSQYYKTFTESGVNIYNVPAYLGDQGINSTSGIGIFRPAMWVGERELDLTRLKTDIEEILAINPQAMIVVRIHLDPPRWWENNNPNELCRLEDGSPYRVSFSSEKWRIEAGDMLELMVEQLLDSRFKSSIIGIHVAGGMTEEWFYHYKRWFYDESEVRVNGFRGWLARKYKNDDGLFQTAWHKDDLAISQAMPVDISGKDAGRGWRDGKMDRSYFDTFDYQAELMADNIAYYAKIVKEASGGCLLTGAFYGYHYFVTDPRRGHGALAKLLRCPDLDYLSSPNDYNRKVGEDWPAMAAIKSIQLHGKLWMAENDTRTYLTTLLKEESTGIDPGGDWYTGGVWLGPKSEKLSHGLLLKNLGRMLAYGYGGWWFDMWGGWFSDDVMQDIVKVGMDNGLENKDENEFRFSPEVAVVVDERLSFWDKSYGGFSREIIQNRYDLGQTTAPYDLYLRTDIDQIDTGQYKVIWLMGVMDISAEEEKWIGDQKSSMVMHIHKLGTSIYSHSKEEDFENKYEWSAEELAQLWSKAGVSLFGQTGDVIYVGRGYGCIHSAEGGWRKLAFPKDVILTDLMDQKVYKTKENSVSIFMEAGQTKLFRIRIE